MCADVLLLVRGAPGGGSKRRNRGGGRGGNREDTGRALALGAVPSRKRRRLSRRPAGFGHSGASTNLGNGKLGGRILLSGLVSAHAYW